MKWWQHYPLRKKWILTTGFTIFLTYACMCMITLIALQTWLLNSEEQKAQRTVDDLQVFFENQRIQDLQQNTGLLNAIVTQEQTVRLYNFDHIEILRINDVSSAVPVQQSYEKLAQGLKTIERVDGARAYVMNSLVQIGPFEGYMQLIHPLSSLQAMMDYVITTMTILGIGALVFVVVVSQFAVRGLMKPLENLRDSMQMVKEQGFVYDQKIVYNAQDEIGDLLIIYEEMIQQLERAFDQQQQFVSAASHELRTPIQAIEGHLSLVQRWGKDDPVVLAESIETALSETRRMKHLMEELLQLAKNERVDPLQESILEEVLDRSINELKFVSKPFEVSVNNSGPVAPVAVSEQALGQIFRNIMENSIRYSTDDCQIDITIHYQQQDVFVQIADNGFGIAPKHLPYIFERFYRADEARQNIGGGTGLGLSITKMLADKYKIEVSVQSEEAKGTVFLLRIMLSSVR